MKNRTLFKNEKLSFDTPDYLATNNEVKNNIESKYLCRGCGHVVFREIYQNSDRWSGHCPLYNRKVSGDEVCHPSQEKAPQKGNIQLSLF